MRRWMFFISVLPCIWPAQECTAAPRYTVTTISSLVGPSADAWSINNSGQLVGSMTVQVEGRSERHAYLWDPVSGIRDIPPAGYNAVARDVSDSGQVVGFIGPSSAIVPLDYDWFPSGYHAFSWQDGDMIDLGPLDTGCSAAYAVSSSGQVVGSRTGKPYDVLGTAFIWDAGDGMQDLPGGSLAAAFDIGNSGAAVGRSMETASLWHDGVMTDIGALIGDGWSSALAINNVTQVVGAYQGTRGISSAFLWDAQTGMRDLGSLADPSYELHYTVAGAVNNRGQIIGMSDIGYTYGGRNEIIHAFIWEDGAMSDLNDLVEPGTLELTAGMAINDRGQIVIGERSYKIPIPGRRGHVLLTPIPEPESLLALAVGLAGLALRRRGT
ncbi:MAG: hypothetical protein A2Z18_01270 [Armatimonadetes bacterium RBG_16_58_9]|nr:MAG: hypothetical protein A2Z18_01270 [Armatimonadetes bacterium RBG_16_58_9]